MFAEHVVIDTLGELGVKALEGLGGIEAEIVLGVLGMKSDNPNYVDPNPEGTAAAEAQAQAEAEAEAEAEAQAQAEAENPPDASLGDQPDGSSPQNMGPASDSTDPAEPLQSMADDTSEEPNSSQAHPSDSMTPVDGIDSVEQQQPDGTWKPIDGSVDTLNTDNTGSSNPQEDQSNENQSKQPDSSGSVCTSSATPNPDDSGPSNPQENQSNEAQPEQPDSSGSTGGSGDMPNPEDDSVTQGPPIFRLRKVSGSFAAQVTAGINSISRFVGVNVRDTVGGMVQALEGTP